MKRKLLTALIKYQWLNERAYLGNFIAGIASTIFYTSAFIVFVFLLFHRVGTIAGYTRNDLLLVFFVGQIGFFTTWQGMAEPFAEMIRKINTGEFDFVLIHPVPLKSWVTVQGIEPLSGLLEVIPPMIIISLFINWGELHITPVHLILAGVVWLCSMAMCYLILLLLAAPAFSNGESSELLHVFWGMGPQPLPYERIPTAVKFTAFSVLPTILYTSVVTAVVLGRIQATGVVIAAVAAGTAALLMQRLVWRRALRVYTSASS